MDDGRHIERLMFEEHEVLVGDGDRIWGPGRWTLCACTVGDTGMCCVHSRVYHDRASA